MNQPNCRIIALANQKGGTGKTTTTVNLGVGLARQGKRVLLVDADPQGDLTTCLGWQNQDNLPATLATLMEWAIREEPVDIQQALLHHREGVDLLPSNIELSAMEMALVTAMSREFALKEVLSQARNQYDYILIDCMPSLGMITVNALAAADSVIIPVQAQYLPAKGMTQLLHTIGKVKRQINPNLRVDGVLLTFDAHVHRGSRPSPPPQLRRGGVCPENLRRGSQEYRRSPVRRAEGSEAHQRESPDHHHAAAAAAHDHLHHQEGGLPCLYILIKIEPLQPKDYQVTLTKTSADVSITQGNSAYSLAGATYNVYKGTSGTGSVVATFTTDEAGHATLSTPLEDGTYSVKEVTPPKGYKLDEKIYTFTINGADTSLSVEDEPGTLTLKLKKKDSQTGSTPQGNATLAGAVYQVSYQKGGQTVTKELTSDASGNLGTLEGIPFGTVTVKELSAPEGYRLDTEVHTYTVDGSQLTGDVYELEVTDLEEDVQRGGLTIQKLDSETGTTPQGDASLEGISFEIVNDSQNPVVVNGNTAQPGQVAMTITTNAAGVATTGENALPYGVYTVREVSTNDSMLQTFTEEISVTIDEDGEMLEYEAENEVVRGGIDISKEDSEMGSTPQGNSSFAGISFEVVNRSANPVVVGGQTYAVGEVVMTITTDESGTASTGNDALPYGTYEVRESQTYERSPDLGKEQFDLRGSCGVFGNWYQQTARPYQ